MRMRIYSDSLIIIIVFLISSIKTLECVAVESVLEYSRINDSNASVEKIYCRRVVSMSPSTTEMLFELGLGERVVGVTRFCSYPPVVDGIDKVGGYLDPNYEAMALLEPDVVFILPEQENIKEYLKKIGIRTVTVDNKTVGDILNAIECIGAVCGVEERALEIISEMKRSIEKIMNKTEKLDHPRVLICVGRVLEEEKIRNTYVAGGGTFYDELLGYTGAMNACGESKIPYPVLSIEGILNLKPDIIIDLVYNNDDKDWDKRQLIEDWKTIISLGCIDEDSIYIVDDDYSVIPGPRFTQLLNRLAHIIHPDIEF